MGRNTDINAICVRSEVKKLTRMTTLARMRHHWRHLPHVSTSDARFFIVDVDVDHSTFDAEPGTENRFEFGTTVDLSRKKLH